MLAKARTLKWPPVPRRPADPGLAGLRRAARAALVMPGAFAFATFVIGNPQATTFVAFGCFALLVMADFGGPRVSRAIAYLATTAAGAGLVTLGTLASHDPWTAAFGMLLVGFCITFLGMFGSYIAASQTGLLLSFVLAVSIPAPPAQIGARVGGWLLAGAVSTLAGVFLWPRFEKRDLWQRAAAACHTLAAMVRFRGEDLPEGCDFEQRAAAAAGAVRAVHERYHDTQHRPHGPARRDWAFAELLGELDMVLFFGRRTIPRWHAGPRPCLEEGIRLAAAVVATLERSADLLGGGSPPDVGELDAARRAHRQALGRWAAKQLQAERPPATVLAGLQVDESLRILAYTTLLLGTDATIATGGDTGAGLPWVGGAARRRGARGVMTRVVRKVRAHLSPTSIVLRNSMRATIGLALAVLAARLLRLDHAFWVVLGTLSVLRSSALATGRTTLQALAGSALGILVGTIFIATIGASASALWIGLPLTVFVAAYASSALGYVLGQASFTLVVIILFNLIQPVGWRLGLVRIEDVAIGAAISLIVALLFWPRGARVELRQAVGELLILGSRFLDACFHIVLDGGAPADFDQTRRLALDARDRASEAFDQFQHERGSKPLDEGSVALLLMSGKHVVAVGDLLRVLPGMGYEAGACAAGGTALESQEARVLAAFVSFGEHLRTGRPIVEQREGVSRAAVQGAALGCLRRWKEDPSAGEAAIALVVAGEWIYLLDGIAAGLERPAQAAVEAGHVPWWR